MTVLHIFNEIKYSGAEVMYASAASLFQKQGFKLMALNTSQNMGAFSIKFEEVGIQVFHMPFGKHFFSLDTLRCCKSFYYFLKKNKIEVLHIHRNNIYFPAIIAWYLRIRVIATMHSTFRNRWVTLHYARLRRLVMRRIFNVTFQSIGESVYANELNYYKNPTIKVNNWYDSKRFYPTTSADEKNNIRQRLNIANVDFLIISTGGCSTIKNHHDIIKALAIVRKEINCHYLHLGCGITAEEEIALAKKLGVFDCIQFLGSKDDVRSYLLASDAYVMSSRIEGLGNAALEAMASGLPTILYNVSGLKDLISVNNNNGYLVEPNHDHLAEGIKFLYHNPSAARRMSKNAKRNVDKFFHIEKNVPQIIGLYLNRK